MIKYSRLNILKQAQNGFTEEMLFKNLSKILIKLKSNINREFHKNGNVEAPVLAHELPLSLLNLRLNQSHSLPPQSKTDSVA